MKKLLCNRQFILIALLILVIGGVFYWFAYRPTQIRHECSWVEHIIPAKPGQPAITKEEAEISQRERDKCLGRAQAFFGVNNQFNGLFDCKESLKEGPAIPAKPERIEYRKAVKEQYEFCIREHGLWR